MARRRRGRDSGETCVIPVYMSVDAQCNSKLEPGGETLRTPHPFPATAHHHARTHHAPRTTPVSPVSPIAPSTLFRPTLSQPSFHDYCGVFSTTSVFQFM